MGKIFIALLLFYTLNLQAGTLRIVSGEYAPYCGEKLPGRGMSTQLVEVIFKESKKEIKIEFMPWKRAMNYLLEAEAAGSFSWTMNEERKRDFYYSDPLHQYRVLYFVNKKSGINGTKDFKKKKICQPSGWDITLFEKAIETYEMQLTRPINAESCFRMLGLGRVDVVGMNEHVGVDLIHQVFGAVSPAPITFFDSGIALSSLYFIVPKKYPEAPKIIKEFNQGLAKIRRDGMYLKIVEDYMKQRSSIVSSCETCNRLGSL